MIKALLFALLLQLPPVPFPPIESPTPIPTSTPVLQDYTVELPTTDLINYLATAESNLSNAPTDLRNPAGPILPNTNGSQVFGYSKWLMSPATANEIFGPFGLVVSHVAAAVTLVIILALVYFLIYVAVLIVRFVVWIISTILKVVPFVG
ncbi:MAG: hypothetical protein HZC41_25050 [Chloroflexi bacterium]|nr:hypothetical protein [Chloroflexota bacterium]